jgi:hypothetical protein
MAASHRFPIESCLADAVTLGTGALTVDGVLFVAEHGKIRERDRWSAQLNPSIIDAVRAYGERVARRETRIDIESHRARVETAA